MYENVATYKILGSLEILAIKKDFHMSLMLVALPYWIATERRAKRVTLGRGPFLVKD